LNPVWSLAALWLRLASAATLALIWLKIDAALSEIVVGAIARPTYTRVRVTREKPKFPV
jgi:hypothetical protein